MTDSAFPHSSADERRLAAVVFTDVAGYSVRMQRDEPRTLALVRHDFARIEALCVQHGGSVLNRMGDGMLLCFSSVVQAVTCALQIQTEFAQRKKTTPLEQCLDHRIGIHLGDIFLDGQHVAGDGVNIAARLQTRAAPGGICISQTVRDTVKGKISVEAISLGAQEFKNFAEPISVFHLAPEGGPPAPAVPRIAPPAHSRRLLVAGLVATAVVIGTGIFFFVLRPAPAPPTTASAPAAASNRVSLAVLPFSNLSEDPSNAFFADGVHEDVLGDLGNLDDFKVISRRSVSQYRGTTKPLRTVASELNVSHVLEGSVRRAGKQIRLSVQLIDAKSDEQLWAQTYDREMNDVFAIQSEIATKIALALRAIISPREQSHLTDTGTRNVEAYEAYHRGRDVFRRGDVLQNLISEAQPFLERAVKIDANYAVAWADLGRLHLLAYADVDRSATRLAQARAAIDTAVKLAPQNPAVMFARAELLAALNDFEPAAVVYRAIISAYPNHAHARVGLSDVAQRLGRWPEALSMLREAQVLDPHGPETLSNLSNLFVRVRRYTEGEAMAKQAAALVPISLLRSFQLALIPFHARGETAAVQAVVSAVPASTLRHDRNAVVVSARWAFARGDAAEVIRIWQESGAISASFLHTAVAAAFLARGEATLARPLLERDRARLLADSVANPKDSTTWCNLALTHALLGEVALARGAAEKAHAFAADLPDIMERNARTADLACMHAWVGDKARAVELIAPVLRQPGTAAYANVHELKRSLLWRPLQEDPAFLQLLGDPANNAPLL